MKSDLRNVLLTFGTVVLTLALGTFVYRSEDRNRGEESLVASSGEEQPLEWVSEDDTFEDEHEDPATPTTTLPLTADAVVTEIPVPEPIVTPSPQPTVTTKKNDPLPPTTQTSTIVVPPPVVITETPVATTVIPATPVKKKTTPKKPSRNSRAS